MAQLEVTSGPAPGHSNVPVRVSAASVFVGRRVRSFTPEVLYIVGSCDQRVNEKDIHIQFKFGEGSGSNAYPSQPQDMIVSKPTIVQIHSPFPYCHHDS